MKRLHHGLTGFVCLALCAYVQAQTPVDFYQSWSGSGLRGWTNSDGIVTLSNPGGYLALSFGSQGQPEIQAGMAYTNLVPGVLPTNIAFAIKGFQYEPSALRVYVHTMAEGRTWYYSAGRVATNEWTLIDVPVSFGDYWISDPGLGQADFQADMLTADWIGVYLRRNGSPNAQTYGIDDFLIQGLIPPTRLTISGTVIYDGVQAGNIYVSAASMSTTVVDVLTSPGSYAMTNVPLSQTFTVAAYRDSNANGTQEFWEANGAWLGNPAVMYMDDLNDANIAMSDPTSADGLPYWWLNQYFGVTEPGGGGGGGPTQSEGDPDDDRFATGDEYWAGTDPTNALSFFMVDMTLSNNAGTVVTVLSWDSIPDRTYGVWRSESIGGGFVKIQSGLPTTPPLNTFEDTTATGRGPYFYRVEVER